MEKFSEILSGWFAYILMSFDTQAIVIGLFFLLVLIFIAHIMNSKNDLQWFHLVSVRADDGKQYASWNQIGQGMGVVVSVWMPFLYVNSPKMDALGLAAVMGVSLLYLGGVSGYSKYIRAKQNSDPPAGILK